MGVHLWIRYWGPGSVSARAKGSAGLIPYKNRSESQGPTSILFPTLDGLLKMIGRRGPITLAPLISQNTDSRQTHSVGQSFRAPRWTAQAVKRMVSKKEPAVNRLALISFFNPTKVARVRHPRGEKLRHFLPQSQHCSFFHTNNILSSFRRPQRKLSV